MKPFLPFTRPSIDEQSIAAVADVFRSGQLASGPKVLAFEAALEAYIGGGRRVRVMTSATAGLEMALEIAGVGEGDEVIVPAMSFAASANVVARVRAGRCSSTSNSTSESRPRSGGARHHAEHPRHHARAFRGLAGGHGCALRDRRAASPARGRGCGARHRVAPPGPADRQLRGPDGLQLSSEQEHDLPSRAARSPPGMSAPPSSSSNTGSTASSAIATARST